jgi:SpoVK/Ycf46/Vps4 family AAA+-type ATPase
LVLILVGMFFGFSIFRIQANSLLDYSLVVYVILSILLFLIVDFLGINICRELELSSLEVQKSFGKFGLQDLSKTPSGPSSLADVGGYEELKQELYEAIAMPLKLKDFSKAYGLKMASGILLFGPPGTGKTLTVLALAKELKIPFFYVKCSDILSSWYGESERNISELFATAKKNAPCILFFDEIDALAKSRDLFFADDVGPRVLSVLLSEMDGIKSDSQIVVIGATNCPHRLDSAILRPGRLDKIIYMPLPDFKARLEILKIHTSKIQLDKDVNLEEIAKKTEGFSGADLANLIVEAKRLAIREAHSKNKLVPLSAKHIFSVLYSLKPSVSEEQLNQYKEFEKTYKRSLS